VTDTQPAIKGSTATNQLKEAELETGLKTRVPGFILTGETIRINLYVFGYGVAALKHGAEIVIEKFEYLP